MRNACPTQTKTSTQRGNRGAEEEHFAECYLKNQGLSLVARNFRSRYGEIDLIMQDKQTLVYVEVRQRKSANYGSALESISIKKQQKLIKAAQFYAISTHITENHPQRFDVIGLTGQLPNVQIDWIKNAF